MIKEEEARSVFIEKLRRDLSAAAEQIKRGEFKEYDSGDSLMDDIKKLAEERLAKKLSET